MNDKKKYLLRIIPIVGWIYIIFGLLFPFENRILWIFWIIDIAASVGLHAIQLFIAIPVGKKAGFSTIRSIFMTMLFGATWWKPLKEQMD